MGSLCGLFSLHALVLLSFSLTWQHSHQHAPMACRQCHIKATVLFKEQLYTFPALGTPIAAFNLAFGCTDWRPAFSCISTLRPVSTKQLSKATSRYRIKNSFWKGCIYRASGFLLIVVPSKSPIEALRRVPLSHLLC